MSTSPTGFLGAMKRILLVEDEPALAELLASVLKEEGYDVNATLSAEDALASCGSRIPDLIMSDLKLVEMDGLTLLEQVHSTKKLKNIPFLLVTASGEASVFRKAKELGARGYITKPIELGYLVRTVKEILPSQ